MYKIFIQRHNVVASETLTVTDYRGRRQTFYMSVKLISKHAQIILKQSLVYSTFLGIETRQLADNRVRLSAHCANKPQRQAKTAAVH